MVTSKVNYFHPCNFSIVMIYHFRINIHFVKDIITIFRKRFLNIDSKTCKNIDCDRLFNG